MIAVVIMFKESTESEEVKWNCIAQVAKQRKETPQHFLVYGFETSKT